MCQHARAGLKRTGHRATGLEHLPISIIDDHPARTRSGGDVPVWLVIVIFVWIEATVDAFA